MDTCEEKDRVDVSDIPSHFFSSDLELVSPLPAVPDRRKRKIQLHPMVRVSVFRDCGEDTDHRCFQGVDIPVFTAKDLRDCIFMSSAFFS